MTRLDVLLVSRSLAKSRTLAARLIEEGCVQVDGNVVTKASQKVSEDVAITVANSPLTRYVSRGGLKLEHALETFGVSPEEKRAFDFGASTGGFCDCLLRRGVALIYAVDVGKSQLADEIRFCDRVVVLEEQDARTLSPDQIPEPCDLGVMDVSFISQGLLYESCARCLTPGADLITLYKPQFEVGREFISKGGIVRSRSKADAALERLIEKAAANHLRFVDHTDSPILGGDGNREELLHFVREEYV